MGREQLRGFSHSLLMQEVRHRKLSPGFSPNHGQRTRNPPSHHGNLWPDGSAHYPPLCECPRPHVDNVACTFTHVLEWHPTY